MKVHNTENKSHPLMTVVLCLLLLAVFVISNIPFLAHDIIAHFLVKDHSARWVNQDSFSWNGNIYTMTSGRYREGRTIARTGDGFDINEVEGDPDHIFLVARMGIDQALYAQEDYEIPTDGKVTTVCWGYKSFADEAFCAAVGDLVNGAETDFVHEMENPYGYAEDWKMKPLYLAYQDCPVPTEYKGELGRFSGRWVLVTKILPTQEEAPFGQERTYEVFCTYVPEEIAQQLEKTSNSNGV